MARFSLLSYEVSSSSLTTLLRVVGHDKIRWIQIQPPAARIQIERWFAHSLLYAYFLSIRAAYLY
jgi:hypothetical protein